MDTILVSYQTYKREFQTANEKKKALETTKAFHQNQLLNSPVKSVHDDCIDLINTQLKSIVTPKQPKLVGFVCDEKKLLSEVNELCKLVERVSEIDYQSKTQSIISVCDRGTGNEQLKCPNAVTVDHNTGNIYVADYGNHCVKVFDNTAKYLFKFGNGKGEGKMSNPISLLLCVNRVLVTQYSDYIQVYELDGKFVTRFGGSGNRKLQFYLPSVYLQMNTMVIFIFVIIVTIVFKLSLKPQYKSEFGLVKRNISMP